MLSAHVQFAAALNIRMVKVIAAAMPRRNKKECSGKFKELKPRRSSGVIFAIPSAGESP